MSPRRVAVLLVILAVLSLQFLVPAVQLSSDGAQRWGWQMYSREPQRGDVVAVLSSGEMMPIPSGAVLFRQRGEIRYDPELFEAFCRVRPGIQELRIHYNSTGEVEEFECNG